MANPHRGEVTFKAADTEYTLAFSTNAICELEELLDNGINAIVANMERLMTVRAMLWAGLRTKHPDITLDKAGKLIDICGMLVATDAINKALQVAFPPPDESSAKNG